MSDCQAQVSTYLDEFLALNLQIVFYISLSPERFFVIHRIECGLQSVTVEDGKLLEHHHSAS